MEADPNCEYCGGEGLSGKGPDRLPCICLSKVVTIGGGAEGKETIEKPPRGVRPRWLVDEQRMDELLGAIARFTEAKETIPPEWIGEYKELREKIEGRGTVTLTHVNSTND